MIEAKDYAKMLVDAGIVDKDDKLRRVTIDCLPNDVVMIYIEKFAGDRLVKLFGKLGETLKEV